MPTPTTPDPHQPADATARRAAARAFAARTRAAQGLPLHVQDPQVIAELVMLFRPALGDGEPAQHHHSGEHLPGTADRSVTGSADRAAGPSAG